MRFGLMLLFALGVTVLGGCKLIQDEEATVTEPAPAPEPEVPVVQFQPEPGLTARERMRKALDLLQVGQAGQARAELSAYLPEVPDSQLARNLLLQIDADPIKMLGEEFFLYRIRRGDSISSIAGKMLGDPMKFHILARYNDLENPSEIKVGQVIRIPGKQRVAQATPQSRKTAPPRENKVPTAKKKPAIVKNEAADSVAEAPAPAKTPDVTEAPKAPEVAEAPKVEAGIEAQPQVAAAPDQAGGETVPAVVDDGLDDGQIAALSSVETAEAEELKAATIKRAMLKFKGHSDRGDLDSALNHLEEGLFEYPDASELQTAAVEGYTKLSDRQIGAGELTAAEKSLRRASEIAPNDPMVGKQLAALQKRQQVESLFQEGGQLQSEGKNLEAFEVYKRITALEPGHEAANEELDKLRPAVTEALDREAKTAMRQQDLDTAISKWEKALEVDPGYVQARLERDRAIDLKKRIESLPSN